MAVSMVPVSAARCTHRVANGECGKIVIKSTVKEVVAIAGDECENNIGAGVDGTCGEVTIEDKTKILDE